MKRISILGSTGSIGVNALSVIDNLQDEFKIIALSAHKNGKLLIEQAKKYKPEVVSIIDLTIADLVRNELSNSNTKVLVGREGLLELSKRNDIDLMLNGLVGASGMAPTLNSIQQGVDVALSNKESLVMAGDIITRIGEEKGSKIFPVDSEHSAIWQCLVGEAMNDVKRIILTGSGGPFRTRNINSFKEITPKEALKHPNWNMGNKITIDSATMMNKGLEVIEALWLFKLTPEQIDIVIHPQSIIHSMVEFNDESVKAQLGIPDMKIPIQYALTYPRHLASNWESLDLVKIGALTFEEPDLERFPCINLAYEAINQKGSTPAVLNIANEQAVYRFLNHQIGFLEIPNIIEEACNKHDWIESPNLDDLNEIENWTTIFVKSYQSKYK
ncbi:MAG: 1-deoxy-D-xylulose-5-phosphate reductoisomerase [Candidatus Marinimicrobia bacterium]|nr:1-deoxy-D-xylulose-5-phosphate reductoisomerase [Candidatus Neomarinimicrobiota bacterium]